MIFGQKKVPFWVKTVFLGQEVHYYMVYYMVYCKLYRIPFANLQLSANLMHLSRKWQIRSWRKFQRPFLCSLKGCQILPPWFCTKEPNVSKKLPSLKSFAPSKMTFKTIWNMELGFWGRKQTLNKSSGTEMYTWSYTVSYGEGRQGPSFVVHNFGLKIRQMNECFIAIKSWANPK